MLHSGFKPVWCEASQPQNSPIGTVSVVRNEIRILDVELYNWGNGCMWRSGMDVGSWKVLGRHPGDECGCWIPEDAESKGSMRVEDNQWKRKVGTYIGSGHGRLLSSTVDGDLKWRLSRSHLKIQPHATSHAYLCPHMYAIYSRGVWY